MEKRAKREIGVIQFWNEAVVYYRNKRKQAAKSGRLQDVINYTGLLADSREQLKYVEGVILRDILALILVCSMFIGGCHTVDGIGGDLKAWSSPYIQTQEK